MNDHRLRLTYGPCTRRDTSSSGSLHFALPPSVADWGPGDCNCSECFAAAYGSIVISTCRWAVLARSVLATAAAAWILAPVPSGAQEEGSPGGDQAGQSRRGQIDLDIDVLRVEHVEVEEALGDLAANVAAQQAALAQAEAAVFQAEAELNVARAAVDDAQSRLDDLNVLTDLVVVDAFMSPPVEAGLEALTADSLSEVSIKQSILNTEATSDAALLDAFAAAEVALEAERAGLEDAAAAGAERRSDAEAALADLRSALSQQVQFIADVESRLDQRLAEAQNLADVDPELAAQILAREAELAGVISEVQGEVQAEAARELAAQLAQQAESERSYGSLRPPPGGLDSAPCPTGGSVTVAGDIVGAVGRLLDAAGSAGLSMCGTGYRDPQEQINLRRSNCGASDYYIYQAPSSACSPPTARPGSSLHEAGLAIDFTCGGSTVSYGTSCFTWLQNNAAEFGLYNLPGEPWHFSVDGN